MAEYPNGIKSFRRVVNRDLSQGIIGDIVLAEDHNEKAEEIEAIEQTLGVNPQGSFGSVKERIEAIEALPTPAIYTEGIEENTDITGQGSVDRILLQDIPIENGKKFLIEIAVQLYFHDPDAKANIISLIKIDGGGWGETGLICRCITTEATSERTFYVCSIPELFTGTATIGVGVRIKNIYSIMSLKKAVAKLTIL